jgi:hypothetical protein
MQPDQIIEKLKAARDILGEVYEGTDIPQIQSMMRHADMNLHWALWNLGEVETLRPDLKV